MSRSALVGLSAGGLLLALALAALGVVGLRAGEALPGVTVDAVDVGGLGRDDLRETLTPLVEARASEQVTLVHDGERFAVDPEAVGLDVDLELLVDEVLAAGRGGVDGMRRALTGADDVGIRLAELLRLDRDAVAARIDEVADEIDGEPSPGSVSVDPSSLEVVSTPPADGFTTDRDATASATVDALLEGGGQDVPVAGETLPAVVDPGSVRTVAEQAQRAVAEDLTLRGGGDRVVLAPRDLAQLLSSRQRGTGDDAVLELAVTPQDAEAVLGGIVGPLLTEPRAARFDAPRTPTVRFDDQNDAVWRPVEGVDVGVVPSADGTSFDAAMAASQLELLLAQGVRDADLRLAVERPDLTTEQARAFGVDTLLSTFTTYHACCQTRVTNIQKLADVVDGDVVMPGEQFSINQLSGVRECAKGYAAAGMILDGEIVDSCGGGVSQFGTTTVNAVFFAGFDPDAYKPHSFYISRYPMAREATLNFPSPDIDVRFTNTSGAPVIVRTSYTSTSITVSFYGNTDVEEVRADLGTPSNPKPYPTRRRENLDLPPGTSRVVQGGRDGFSVGLTRTVVREGGATSSDDWSNTYVPQIEIVEFNPNPAPSPSPSPSPSPDDA